MAEQNEIKSLLEEQGKATVALREYIDRKVDEVKKIGAELPETKSALDKINQRLDGIEVKLNAPPKPEAKESDRSPEVKAFEQLMRHGPDRLSEQERKVLSVGVDTGAGYLAPREYVEQITKTLTEYSPIRQYASVRQTVRKAIEVPRRTAQHSASWVAELGTKSETTGLAYGLDVISTHECYADIRLTNEMIEDAAFNMQSEVTAEAAEKFAVLEGTAFVNGTAVGQPEGFMVNSSVSYTASGSASAITADGILGLTHDVKEGYLAGAVFGLSRATLKLVRQLKDGTGQYLWQPGLQAGVPNYLAGYPYFTATDMPSATTNTYPIIFGNFRRAYLIVDRIQVELLRDPYTASATGTIIFLFRKRVGAAVINTEAIRKLKCATS